MELNIDHLAALSRIALTDEEKSAIKKDLTGILEYVAQINELDLTGVEPTSHVLAIENVFREDAVGGEAGIAKKVLDALPEDAKEGPFFKVPKIIESIA